MKTEASLRTRSVIADHRPVHELPYEVYSLRIGNALPELAQHLPARDAIEAVVDIGPRHPERPRLAGFNQARDGVPDTQTTPVGKAPRQQERIDHRIKLSKQRSLHDAVDQRRYRELANRLAPRCAPPTRHPAAPAR
jgi:hypothetical protein